MLMIVEIIIISPQLNQAAGTVSVVADDVYTEIIQHWLQIEVEKGPGESQLGKEAPLEPEKEKEEEEKIMKVMKMAKGEVAAEG